MTWSLCETHKRGDKDFLIKYRFYGFLVVSHSQNACLFFILIYQHKNKKNKRGREKWSGYARLVSSYAVFK